ncbi:MAG: hypothetical protein ACYC59_03935 [Anaerolineaceae bacterium]
MPGEPLLFTRDETGVQENSTKYQWVTEGPNCNVCNLMRGRVYALIVWWDTVVPGFHPNCDCRLESVPDDTPESSLDLFGVEPWIDRLNVNTYTRWWIKRLMPWDITEVTALTKAYQETGNWKDAFAKLKSITNPKSLFSNPRLTIFNTQYPFPQFQSWSDGFFTSRFENVPVPYSWLPWERYR